MSDRELCKHCGRRVSGGRVESDRVHLEGAYRGKHRCSTDDSGLPYGYEAETVNQHCGANCLGSLEGE